MRFNDASRDESRYNPMAASAFKRILAATDALDPDVLESDSTGDMVTLTSSRGEKCVVNTQRAVRQVWVARPQKPGHSFQLRRRRPVARRQGQGPRVLWGGF
ncbi:MAG: frataxin domain-containing protein [Myxococcaceae bacterium]